MEIQNKIINVGNQELILDRDVAGFLEMETKVLNQSVKRHRKFVSEIDYFRLSEEAYVSLRSQIVTLEGTGKHPKYMPYVFTKTGIEILATIIKKDGVQEKIKQILEAFEKSSTDLVFTKNELKNEVLTYKTEDGKLHFDVKFDGETVWLSQQQMAELFDTTSSNISFHIINIFEEKELEKEATVKESLIVQMESGRAVKRNVEQYNLDVIISVGYRVKSLRGTQFRQWATKVLKAHLEQGFSVNDRRFSMLEKKLEIQGYKNLETAESLRELFIKNMDLTETMQRLTKNVELLEDIKSMIQKKVND